MKGYLRQMTAQSADRLAGLRLAREYLQARVLQGLQEGGAFLRWACVGGTALRFLHSLPRTSENLDFSATDPRAGGGGELREPMDRVKRLFEAEGYGIQVVVRETKTVAVARAKFPGLLHELDLSPHESQVLSIRVELDRNPPPGAGLETTLVRRYVTLRLQHYDKPSLLAGKLHAILNRRWTKGRDLFDLSWYLAERSWPGPNLMLLNAALKRAKWTGPVLTESNWKKVLVQRLRTLDWNRARRDVLPFLERPADIDLVALDSCLSLLSGR